MNQRQLSDVMRYLPSPIFDVNGVVPDFLIRVCKRGDIEGLVHRSLIASALLEAGWADSQIEMMMEKGNRLPWYPEEQTGERVVIMEIVGFSPAQFSETGIQDGKET